MAKEVKSGRQRPKGKIDQLEIKVKEANEEIPKECKNGPKGYLPQKNLIPKPMGDKLDYWREFKEDVEDLFDTGKEGMRKVLQWIGKQEEEADEHDTWTMRVKDKFQHEIDDKVLDDTVQVWRT